jgi:broad specificity phosphatase PhoE
MTELLLVRHGETKWNVAEVFRGRIDVDLNQTGVMQAELLAEHLKTASIDTVYSSPLQRALMTAQIIAEPHGLEVHSEPGLIDFHYGVWQGLSHQEVKEKYRKLYALWTQHPEQVRVPEGESLEEVRTRTMAVIQKVTATHQGVVVLVSHRVVNKVLICALLGLDNSHFWNVKQDNCGITTFAYQNGQFILTGHNDTSFLGRTGKPLKSDF